MSLTPQDVSRIAHLARLELPADEQAAMLGQLNGFFRHRRADERRRHAAASSRCTPRCRQCRTVALRLREDVVTERNEREAQPAQRAGRRGRPVPGAEGDRMNAAWHDDWAWPRSAQRAARSARSRASRSRAALSGAHRARIERLGAFLARRRRRDAGPGARRRRARARPATAGPLAGVPIAHKDIFVTARLASAPPARRCWPATRSPFDATVVARAGARPAP